MGGPQLCNVMDIKHLFIRGNYREDIFFDKVDLINAWNRIWLSANATGVVILAVQILTNHLHICAESCTNVGGPRLCNVNFGNPQLLTNDAGDPWTSNFMHYLRMSLSEYFNLRYKVHGSLGGRRYGKADVIDPQDDGGDDLKDLIRYILRNVTHHGVTDQYQDWQFSTFKYTFDLMDKEDIKTGKYIPEELKKAYLPASCELRKEWSMTKEGLIVPPQSLFPRKEIETLFNNKSYYLKSCGMPTRREGEGETNERLLCTPKRQCKRVTDQEIIDIINAKSLIPVVAMSLEQRYTAIRAVHVECPAASLRQLERIFSIPFRTISYILKK